MTGRQVLFLRYPSVTGSWHLARVYQPAVPLLNTAAVQQPDACLDTFGPSRGCWWLNIFSSFSVIPTLVRFTESRKLGVGIYFCLLTVIVRTTCRLTVIRWSASQNCWLMELSAFNRLRLLQTALCCSTTCTVFQLIWEIGKSNLTCLTWQNAQPSG